MNIGVASVNVWLTLADMIFTFYSVPIDDDKKIQCLQRYFLAFLMGME